MAITYVVDHKRRRVATRAQGVLTFPELSAYVDADQRAREPGYAELFDASEVTGVDLTAEQVQAMVLRAAQARQKEPIGPTAIVAIQPVVFGLARMYSIHCEGLDVSVAVFQTALEAEQWLNARQGVLPA